MKISEILEGIKTYDIYDDAEVEFITDDSTKNRYEHIHNTAKMVRELCDMIRKQNNFVF